MEHVCRDGGPGVVVETAASGLTLWTCALCGFQASSERCSVGQCGRYATGRCADCNRPACLDVHLSRGKDPRPRCGRCKSQAGKDRKAVPEAWWSR